MANEDHPKRPVSLKSSKKLLQDGFARWQRPGLVGCEVDVELHTSRLAKGRGDWSLDRLACRIDRGARSGCNWRGAWHGGYTETRALARGTGIHPVARHRWIKRRLFGLDLYLAAVGTDRAGV